MLKGCRRRRRGNSVGQVMARKIPEIVRSGRASVKPPRNRRTAATNERGVADARPQTTDTKGAAMREF